MFVLRGRPVVVDEVLLVRIREAERLERRSTIATEGACSRRANDATPVSGSRTNEMSRHAPAGKAAWSKRGARASGPARSTRPSIEATSSASAVRDRRRSCPARRTGRRRRVDLRPGRRRPARSPSRSLAACAAPAARRARRARATSADASRERATSEPTHCARAAPKVEAALGPARSRRRFAAVQEEDRRRRSRRRRATTEQRIAEDHGEHRQRERRRRSRRATRSGTTRNDDEPDDAGAERDPGRDAEEHAAAGRDHLPALREAQEERPPVAEHRAPRRRATPDEVVRRDEEHRRGTPGRSPSATSSRTTGTPSQRP